MTPKHTKNRSKYYFDTGTLQSAKVQYITEHDQLHRLYFYTISKGFGLAGNPDRSNMNEASMQQLKWGLEKG